MIGSALIQKAFRRQVQRADPTISLNDYFSYFNYSGLSYPFIMPAQTLGMKQEVPSMSFDGFIQGIYKRNGPVFACMLVRMLLFAEARFQFRSRRNGRPGELFGTPALDILEHPWPGGTTGDLLTRAMQDVDLGGNFYAARKGNSIHRLRPDWVTLVLGSQSEPDDPGGAMDAEIAGYLYQPGGGRYTADAQFLTPQQVAHFAPLPDPAMRFRGMTWLLPVLQEILGDAAATNHKLQFFENGATPNLVVNTDKAMTPEKFAEFVKMMDDQHVGVANAYRTLYLTQGSTAQVVGANMRQIDFKTTQGAGETRIAAAAGVPAIIAGFSEGLEAATYSNYAQARRRFADGTMRPLWRNIAGSLASIIDVPAGAELWYDDRDISFLKEDLKDAVDIKAVEATTIRTLIEAGFKPETTIAAVDARDFTLLEHTHLFSVQLQPPGSDRPKFEGPEAVAVKTLIDAGFEPNSVVAAVGMGDFEKLVFVKKPPAVVPVNPTSPNPVPPTVPVNPTPPNGNGNGNGTQAQQASRVLADLLKQ